MSLVTLLSCQLALGSALSIPSFETKAVKRDQTDATLYAYGTNSSGWPVSFNPIDSKICLNMSYAIPVSQTLTAIPFLELLYIASNANDTTAGLTPITWDM